MKRSKQIEIGSSPLTIETGHIAKQAGGSCTVRLGDTVVLATACMDVRGDRPRDFLPLTVDYREYTYAAGRIPGGFFKREGRPTEKEIITSRLIDRPLRPLFPDGYVHETQIISFVLSADGENDPDILAINGASTALVLSEIPFYHPVGAVRVALVEGQQVFNPPNSVRDVADLDLIVVGTEEAVVMVEAAANQVSEAVVLDCIFKAHEEIQKIIRVQHQLYRESGAQKPTWAAPEPYPEELLNQVKADLYEPLKAALHTKGKFERKDRVNEVTKPYLEAVPAEEEVKRGQIKKIISTLEEEILRDVIMGTRSRFDGRRLDEIRDISIEVGLLPRTHGSALFTRGETQALVSATLGTSRDAQIIEEYEGESRQKFLLHYNFPPFSVGEVKFLRGPGRREIGHGVLARRALVPMLPHEDDFPYTVRVVSDILESNGSSSMATVCGGSLALFDAGVPMLAPVAGVAMGLIKRDDDFAVLSDIAGQEDHYGDMDFKVAGTREGITALQMDIKITGVTREIMERALAQALAGRLHILEQMEKVIAQPRADLSQYAPRLYTIEIPREKIRDVIGSGGKTIRSIIEETGCQIDIQDDGKIIIASPDEPAARHAIELIERLTEMPEVGKVYTGQVRRVEAYGAFVEIMPGTDGLVHISEMAPYHVRDIGEIAHEGDEMTVKVINIDEVGKVRLSRKAVIMEAPDYDPAQYEGMPQGPSGDSGGGGDRGGRDRDRGDRGGRGGRGRGGGRGGGGGRR
jgi:polyribonucleotide nucleotidyltransferase